MSTELQDGQEIRLFGSGGAPVLLTVGSPFSAQEIEKRLNSREWRREGDDADTSQAGPRPRKEKLSKPEDRAGEGPKPRREQRSSAGDAVPGQPSPRTEILSTPDSRPDEAPVQASGDPDRPAVTAPKSDWIVYVARTQHMSREDAANYTKADLIDMAG